MDYVQGEWNGFRASPINKFKYGGPLGALHHDYDLTSTKAQTEVS